jgi:predicted RNA-binding Zn ribbon-like protein
MGRIDHDSDLDLAVALINTDLVLADPPDRLTDTAVYQRILLAAGEEELAAQLGPDDLLPLRALRAELAAIFDLSIDQAVERLDQLLRDAHVPVRITASDGRAEWASGTDQPGMSGLRSRLVIALADHIVKHGNMRLGVCQAAPCRCVYVDRSRARTRRYCCDQCNDRASAAAYRKRHRE